MVAGTVSSGYKFSFTSSLQDGPIFNSQEVHRAVVQRFGKRLRVIWGDKDDVVPMSTAKYFGQIDLAVIPMRGILSSNAPRGYCSAHARFPGLSKVVSDSDI